MEDSFVGGSLAQGTLVEGMRPSGIPQAGNLEEEGRRRGVAAGCNNSLWVNLCFLVVKRRDEDNAFGGYRAERGREFRGRRWRERTRDMGII